MSRFLKVLCVALLATSFSVAGCDQQKESAPTETSAPAAEEPAAEEAAAPAEEAAAEEAAVEVNEDQYVKAAFELRCVESKLEANAEVREKVLARNNFNQESFAQAAQALEGKESASLAVNTRMENCTEELARGFAGVAADAETDEAVAADDAAPEAAAEKKATPRPAKVGTIRARNISGANFEGAELRLNITNNFRVSGDFKGRREGRSFIIPITGEVERNGNIKASGERGNNSVTVGGQLNANGARGTVSGSIFENSYSVRYNAE